jgi:hypothetical protein
MRKCIRVSFLGLTHTSSTTLVVKGLSDMWVGGGKYVSLSPAAALSIPRLMGHAHTFNEEMHHGATESAGEAVTERI